MQTRIEILWKKKQDMTEEVDKIKLVSVVLWKKKQDMTEELDKIKLINVKFAERIDELGDAHHRFCKTVHIKNYKMSDRISQLERGYTPVGAAQSAVLDEYNE